jgi:tRNA(fMet)-specific endonuclease VapC
MPRLYLLDTDTASYVIDRRLPAVDRRLKRLPAASVAISVITRAELMYGLEGIETKHPLRAGVRMFLITVRCLDWDAHAADWYASIRHRLTVSGQKIGELDMMIAAHAIAVDAVLVTNNMRHYKRIRPQLDIENWLDA